MRQTWWNVFVVGIGSLLLAVSTSESADTVPIPELARWEADMLQFGKYQGEIIAEPNAYSAGRANYMYDPQRVFYQIQDYTHDPTWANYANAAQRFYRDNYILPNPLGPSSYQNFTRGIRLGFQRTGDPLSKKAVILMANTFVGWDSTPLNWLDSFYTSRDTALSIMANLDAELIGAPYRPRLEALLTKALGHIDQWFVTKVAQTYPFPKGPNGETIGLQSFMVGITLQALIQYYEQHPDPRIPPAIKIAVDGLWSDCWVPSKEGFYYSAADKNDVTADLNALIAPAFAWMYLTTGDPVYRDRGDQVFAGGVRHSYLWGSKQFNQAYMWSFDYVKWRRMANARAPGPAHPPALRGGDDFPNK